MSDEKALTVAPETTQAQSTHHDSGFEHALYSKIARLPETIRDELNQRLLDGQGSPEILSWVNNLPEVKEILATHFHGAAINGPNLTHWRQTGYHRWLRQRHTRDLSKYAEEFTKAADGRLAHAAAAMASGKLFEFLDHAISDQSDPNNIVKCAAAASVLQKMEQNNNYIRIASQRLRQGDMRLLLQKDKQQRDTVAIGLRLLGDARAKEIEASSATYNEKIELLGHLIFNKLWEPRLVPTPENSTPLPPETAK